MASGSIGATKRKVDFLAKIGDTRGRPWISLEHTPFEEMPSCVFKSLPLVLNFCMMFNGIINNNIFQFLLLLQPPYSEINQQAILTLKHRTKKRMPERNKNPLGAVSWAGITLCQVIPTSDKIQVIKNCQTIAISGVRREVGTPRHQIKKKKILNCRKDKKVQKAQQVGTLECWSQQPLFMGCRAPWSQVQRHRDADRGQCRDRVYPGSYCGWIKLTNFLGPFLLQDTLKFITPEGCLLYHTFIHSFIYSSTRYRALISCQPVSRHWEYSSEQDKVLCAPGFWLGDKDYINDHLNI